MVNRKDPVRASNGTFPASKALAWGDIDRVIAELAGYWDEAAHDAFCAGLRVEDALVGLAFSEGEVDALLASLYADLEPSDAATMDGLPSGPARNGDDAED